jgi:hypothetical protein|eukprot:COSAG06_NODE_1162_length_10456_cov_56.520614_7_plen_63_part_00
MLIRGLSAGGPHPPPLDGASMATGAATGAGGPHPPAAAAGFAAGVMGLAEGRTEGTTTPPSL